MPVSHEDFEINLGARITMIEKDMAQLVSTVKDNAITFKEHLESEEKYNSKLLAATIEATQAHTQLSTRLDRLVEELQEPLEDYRMRKYGMAWMRSLIGNSKVFLIIAIAIAGLASANGLPILLKLIGVM